MHMILHPSAEHGQGDQICTCMGICTPPKKVIQNVAKNVPCNTYKYQSAGLHFEAYLDQVARQAN